MLKVWPAPELIRPLGEDLPGFRHPSLNPDLTRLATETSIYGGCHPMPYSQNSPRYTDRAQVKT